MEGDWREGQIVTVGRQLTLCMHAHTLTKKLTENCSAGVIKCMLYCGTVVRYDILHVLLVLWVTAYIIYMLYRSLWHHHALRSVRYTSRFYKTADPTHVIPPFHLSAVLNGSSHSPTSLNGAPSTPNGFSNGPAMSSTASLSNQQLPPACGARQLCKLKRFLTTLQQFGNDISPEIGERVRSLVLGLVVSSKTKSEKTRMKPRQEQSFLFMLQNTAQRDK